MVLKSSRLGWKVIKTLGYGLEKTVVLVNMEKVSVSVLRPIKPVLRFLFDGLSMICL